MFKKLLRTSVQNSNSLGAFLSASAHTHSHETHLHSQYAHILVMLSPLTLSEQTQRPGQLQVICIMDEHRAVSQPKQVIKYHNSIMQSLP